MMKKILFLLILLAGFSFVDDLLAKSARMKRTARQAHRVGKTAGQVAVGVSTGAIYQMIDNDVGTESENSGNNAFDQRLFSSAVTHYMLALISYYNHDADSKRRSRVWDKLKECSRFVSEDDMLASVTNYAGRFLFSDDKDKVRKKIHAIYDAKESTKK